jgi:TolA-binding protein
VDPQIIGTVGQFAGIGGGLGLVIYLVILVLKQVERGRTMDQESMGAQIKELKEQIGKLTEKVEKLDTSYEQERKERIVAQEDNERLRLIIIRAGLRGELNDDRSETAERADTPPA